jgi:flagellar biosynthetic protein FliQ
MVAAPLLGVALAIGLFVGILQAATSIQEMTLSFIPKLGAMVLALAIFGSWQIATMVDFFKRIYERIPALFM